MTSSADGEAPPLDPPHIRRHHDREQVLDVLAVILMSMTAILTAWTGFQSAKWGGVMSISFSEANARRSEAVLVSELAGLGFSSDLQLASSWLDATSHGDIELALAYRGLFTPELEAATVAWETADDPPATPLDMNEYDRPGFTTVEQLLDAADERATFALVANQRSDNYVVISVLSASVLFFAALSTKMRRPRLQVVLFVAAALGFVLALTIVTTYPVKV
jgi:hypothetical protein